MYPYKPLSNKVKEIRLVHLRPGREYDEIECSLVHASFPPSPEPFDIETALSDQMSNNDQFLLRSRRGFDRTELPEVSSLLDHSSRRNREYPSVGVPSTSTDDELEAFRHIRSLRRPYLGNRVDSFVPQSSILAMSASVEDESFSEDNRSTVQIVEMGDLHHQYNLQRRQRLELNTWQDKADLCTVQLGGTRNPHHQNNLQRQQGQSRCPSLSPFMKLCHTLLVRLIFPCVCRSF
jgi:hypothetical protein